MTRYDNWIDRLENELQISKIYQTDQIKITCTRNEIVELRLMLSTLKQLEEQNNGRS